MIYLVAPAYNEADNIPILISSIHKVLKRPYELVIVNDGSTDESKQVVLKLSEKYPIKIIGYTNNKGPGYAFKFGFDHVLKTAKIGDVLITLESDNSSDLSKIEKIVTLLKKYDVVICAPLKSENGLVNVSINRKFLTKLNHLILSVFFPINGVDSYSNFFRGYSINILRKLKDAYGEFYITEDGFSAITEILIKLKKLNTRFTSIPAKIDWTQRRGQSKMKVTKYIKRQALLLLKYWLLSRIYLKKVKR